MKKFKLLTVSIILFSSAVTYAQTVLRPLDLPSQPSLGIDDVSIKVKKPGTILNYLSIDNLEDIRSLSIVGILDENDLEVIKSCKKLKSLDLSQCYTTLSEEEQTKRKANHDFLQGMFQAMGKLSEEKYKNGEISYTDNLQTQLFVELTKGSDQVKNASAGCIIPAGAFSNMKFLESVKLPLRASSIESRSFENCSNLKNVTLPPYLKRIGTGAFAFCPKLQDIVFPSTLTSIGSYDQQHTYGKSAACSFASTGITQFDFSNCYFDINSSYDNSWTFRFVDCPVQILKLPQIASIDVGVNNKIEVKCYVPKEVKVLKIQNIKEIHFMSPKPPIMHQRLNDCTIYVPKGCLTPYYAKFNGDGNIIREE